MRARSINGMTTEEIRLAFAKSIADNFEPTLAIVFTSITGGNLEMYNSTTCVVALKEK